MITLPLPSQKYISTHLRYNPKTGQLWWRISRRGRQMQKPAGSINAGYVDICLDYKRDAAHRLIWKLVTGKDPKEEIDHHDLDGTNNRWQNLREATNQQNKWNVRRRADNTSRYKGVSWGDNKWQVTALINKKFVYLGGFYNKKEAAAAYKAFIKKHRGNFARL